MNKLKRKLLNLILSKDDKREIFKEIQRGLVEEDIECLLKEENPSVNINSSYNQKLITKSASKYVDLGRYDCNYSYWDNLHSLINETKDEIK